TTNAHGARSSYAKGNDTENEFVMWANKTVSDSNLDMVWLTDSKGKIIARWSRPGNSLVPEDAPDIPDDVSMGILHLDKCGPVIFARHDLPDDRQKRQFWALLLVDDPVLTSLWNASGGKLGLLPWFDDTLPDEPEATKIDKNAQWVSSENKLSVSWLVRDPNGKAIAFFRANPPILDIRRGAA
ncbi:MAG: hypothetical protein GY794_08505, partial [bacterium]|nr:hypothetical protein [bacterium]